MYYNEIVFNNKRCIKNIDKETLLENNIHISKKDFYMLFVYLDGILQLNSQIKLKFDDKELAEIYFIKGYPRCCKEIVIMYDFYDT